ncbi:3099_t:CDS:2, partial [Cetraspora pellucida]
VQYLIIQMFTTDNIVFISNKYIVEKFEQCITVAYVSVLDSKNPNHEFNLTDGVATKYLVNIIDADTDINSSRKNVQCHEKAKQSDDDELDKGEISQEENEEQEENY